MKRIIIVLTVPLFLQIPSLQAAEVIELSQTACQIIEAEAGEQQFDAHTADQCEEINGTTSEQRLAKATPLRLKAGNYIFRVSNRDVPYELGFWLRGAGFSRITLPSVSGGGLHVGNSKDYNITLEPGEYRYSCPLNPTPDYVLIVE